MYPVVAIALSVPTFSLMWTQCCKKKPKKNKKRTKKPAPVVEQPKQQPLQPVPAEDKRQCAIQQEKETKPQPNDVIGTPKLASTQPSVIKTDPTQLDSFQKPVDDEKMADAKDPNYRSFKGIGNEIFIKPKEEVKKTEDDNQYVSLANLNEIPPAPMIESNKEKKRDDQEEDQLQESNKQADDPAPKKRQVFKRPEMGKVSAKNPQYETLANLDDGIFKNTDNKE